MATVTYTPNSVIFTAAENMEDAEDIVVDIIQMGYMSAVIKALAKLGYEAPEDWNE